MPAHRTVPLLLAAFLALAAAAPAAEPPLGPENHGLRLGLHIARSEKDGADLFRVTLRIRNAGPPVTLVADWPYEDLRGDYAEFVKCNVDFLTFPEVSPAVLRTAGPRRASPQPTRHLERGEEFVVSWTASKRLKPPGTFELENTTPDFPVPGRYGVRARLLVRTDEGRRILLASNEVPVPVGGSDRMPPAATGRILEARPRRGTVLINLGSDQGIRRNDTFLAFWGQEASWHLRVRLTTPWLAECEVNLLHRTGAGTPEFPERHWVVRLQPRSNGAPVSEAPQ
jgi:hypothetical protein